MGANIEGRSLDIETASLSFRFNTMKIDRKATLEISELRMVQGVRGVDNVFVFI